MAEHREALLAHEFPIFATNIRAASWQVTLTWSSTSQNVFNQQRLRLYSGLQGRDETVSCRTTVSVLLEPGR